MHIVRDLEDFLPFWDRASLTLGVFDGMHRGHQKIIQRVQKRSKGARHARVLVTYHPHPDIVLGKRESLRGVVRAAAAGRVSHSPADGEEPSVCARMRARPRPHTHTHTPWCSA